MSASPPDQDLKEYQFKYDPDKILEPKITWPWILAACFALLLIGGAAGYGLIHGKSVPFIPATEVTAVPNVQIADTIDENALLLVGTNGAFSEIKLATTTTNTVVVNDLTRGKAQALAAALSPLQDRVAFLQEEGGHRKVLVTDLSGNAKPMDKPLGTFYAQMEPCSWSPVAWSPDSKRFSLFACGKDSSVLVVVEAEPELTPIVLKNTSAPQSPPRQVFWLTNDSLLYTHLDSSTQRIFVSRIKVGEDIAPLAVYGK